MRVGFLQIRLQRTGATCAALALLLALLATTAQAQSLTPASTQAGLSTAFLDSGFQQDATPLVFDRLRGWFAEEPLLSGLFPNTGRLLSPARPLRQAALGSMWQTAFRQDLHALPDALLDARLATTLSLRDLGPEVKAQLAGMVLASCVPAGEDLPEGPDALEACARTDLATVIADLGRLRVGPESLMRQEHKALLALFINQQLYNAGGWPAAGTRRVALHLNDYLDAAHGNPPALHAGNPCRAETQAHQLATWPGDVASPDQYRAVFLARVACEASNYNQPAVAPVLAERLRQEQTFLPERPLERFYSGRIENPSQRLLVTMYLSVVMERVRDCIAADGEGACPDLDYDEEDWAHIMATWQAKLSQELPARMQSLALAQSALRLLAGVSGHLHPNQNYGELIPVLANMQARLSARAALLDHPHTLRLTAALQLLAVLQESRPSWARVGGVTWDSFAPAVCGRSSTFGWARVAAALRYTGGVPKFNDVVRRHCADLFELALQVQRLNGLTGTYTGSLASNYDANEVLGAFMVAIDRAHQISVALTGRIMATWPEEGRAFGVLPPEAGAATRAMLHRALAVHVALNEERHAEAATTLLALYAEAGGRELPPTVPRLMWLGSSVDSAPSSQEVASAFHTLAVPQAGYRAKRDGEVNLWTLNAYVGLQAGSEQLLSDSVDADTRSGTSFGLWAPVGFEYAWGTGNSSWSFFLPVLDFGAVASERAAPSEVTVDGVDVGVGTEPLRWENLFSPGVAVMWGLSNQHPTVLGLSLQYTAEHRTLQTGASGEPVGTMRALLIFAFDLPLAVY